MVESIVELEEGEGEGGTYELTDAMRGRFTPSPVGGEGDVGRERGWVGIAGIEERWGRAREESAL